MEQFLDLRCCWRDVRMHPESGSRNYAMWWLAEDDVGALVRLGLYHLDALAEYECLFLLGRPGAGKTSEIQRLVLGQTKGFSEEFCVSTSCKEIGPSIDQELIRVPEWRAAIQQSKPIRLVLDALEGYLRDANYFNAFKLGLRNLRSEHPGLRLLLVCRPAEWDASFCRAISEIWQGQQEPKVFALEPLPPQHQSELAEHWGITDADELFRWIRRNNFEEFAAWPRSPKRLTDQFRTSETDVITYTELCKRRAMRSFPEEDKRIEAAGRTERIETWTHALMLMGW